MDEATTLHTRDFNYIGNTANTWERFYDNYDRFAKSGDYDRDAFRINYESVSDQWRGAGTDKP